MKKLFVLKRDNGHPSRFAAAVSGTALVLTLAAAAEISRRRAIRVRERRRRFQTRGQPIAVGNGNSGRARTVRKTDRRGLLRSLYRKGRVSQTLNEPVEPVAAISAQGM